MITSSSGAEAQRSIRRSSSSSAAFGPMGQCRPTLLKRISHSLSSLGHRGRQETAHIAEQVAAIAHRVKQESVDLESEAEKLWTLRQSYTHVQESFDDEVLQRISLRFLQVYGAFALQNIFDKGERSALAEKIVLKLDSSFLFLPFLISTTRREAELQTCRETLFRQDCFSNKLSSVYVQAACPKYIDGLISKLLGSINTFGKRLELWVVNPNHLRGTNDNPEAYRARAEGFEFLVNTVLLPYLKTITLPDPIANVLKVRMEGASSRFTSTDGSVAGDSLFWLRVFADGLDDALTASGELVSTPRWSIAYSFHDLLVKASSRAEPAPLEINNSAWMKCAYRDLQRRCYPLVLDSLSGFSALYSSVKLPRIKGLGL